MKKLGRIGASVFLCLCLAVQLAGCTTKTPAADRVSLDQTSVSIEVGSELLLEAEVLPKEAAAVSWTSSAPDIASVEDGLVKALVSGRATITASSGSVSASCAVSVFGIDGVLAEWFDEDTTPIYSGVGVNDEENPVKSVVVYGYLARNGMYVAGTAYHGLLSRDGRDYTENTAFEVYVQGVASLTGYWVHSGGRKSGIYGVMLTDEYKEAGAPDRYRTSFEMFIPFTVPASGEVRFGWAFRSPGEDIRVAGEALSGRWYPEAHEPETVREMWYLYADGIHANSKTGETDQGTGLGTSPLGHLPTAGFDLSKDSGVLPSAAQTMAGEQHAYFKNVSGTKYLVSAFIRPGNTMGGEPLPKVGIIAGENDAGISAFAIDLKTGIETYAAHRTASGQWDWLVSGGVSNAPVAVSPLIDAADGGGTRLTVVRDGTTFYCFIDDTYIYKRTIPSLTGRAAAGLMTFGTTAVFSGYTATENQAAIAERLEQVEEKSGRAALTLGDSLFDFHDDTIDGTIPSMLYESGYDDFYKDNVGGSKATPEAALTGRSIVTHIDAGVYDGLPKMSLIIIQRGTNDCANWRNGNVQKGTAASTDKNTTYGAIKYICAYFSTRFPEARIVWSNIIYRGDGDWPEHTEYNNALLSICPDYGVEVFDLRTAIGITASNYTSYLRADKLHLNAAGEQLMKNAWKGFLS